MAYGARFRRILPFRIDHIVSVKCGEKILLSILPKYLEYSEKDDKFRLIGFGDKLGGTVNLGRIISCEEDEEIDKTQLKYKITVDYDKDDETELVIRVLSFGQMIKVVKPQHFINLIKDRLVKL